MDAADLSKLIRRELELAKKDSTERRQTSDASKLAYENLLNAIVVPLLKQVMMILRAEGWPCQVFTPAGSARLVSEHAANDYIEFDLDASVAPPRVVGRVSLTRGRQGMLVDEQVVAAATPIAEMKEADVLAFLLPALRQVLSR